MLSAVKAGCYNVIILWRVAVVKIPGADPSSPGSSVAVAWVVHDHMLLKTVSIIR